MSEINLEFTDEEYDNYFIGFTIGYSTKDVYSYARAVVIDTTPYKLGILAGFIANAEEQLSSGYDEQLAFILTCLRATNPADCGRVNIGQIK